ncbi:MAG: NlpC/P60 family protein [Ancalomicrobiaceae bacterium]|nr:NlpC/P60 family protein [Ancalomicrobiaceae bacterium]
MSAGTLDAAGGARIVAQARGWIGTPYRHQASLKGVGCDCLGLIRGLWRDLYGAEPEIVPAYAPDWAEAAGREALAEAGRRHLIELAVADASPGDILLFRWRDDVPAKHAGVMATRQSFVHAYDGSGVVESALGPWWRRRIAFAFRFPELPAATAPTITLSNDPHFADLHLADTGA